jgi:hypothetical protein
MKAAAIIMILLAVVIGVLPQFTDCESQGRSLTLANGREIPMKCHWTARAEIGLAVPLLFTGMLMTTTRRKETLRNLSMVGATLGAFVIMLPTVLVGVCANPDMICNSLMKPSLILSGALVIGLSLFGVVRTFSKKEDQVGISKAGLEEYPG